MKSINKPALVESVGLVWKKRSIISIISWRVCALLKIKTPTLLTEEDVLSGYVFINGKWKVKLSELQNKNWQNVLEASLERNYMRHLYSNDFIWRIIKSFITFKREESKENNSFEYIE